MVSRFKPSLSAPVFCRYALVSSIFYLRDIAQIFYPVICRVVIDMVNPMLRPTTFFQKPNRVGGRHPAAIYAYMFPSAP